MIERRMKEIIKDPNLVAFGLIFRSDSAACVRQIREKGIESHANDMGCKRRHTIRK